MNFKPNCWKVLVSIIVIMVSYYYQMTSMIKNCSLILEMCNCIKQGFSILPSCCGCASNINGILNDLIIILLPGILIYIIWSLFDKKKEDKTKNKRYWFIGGISMILFAFLVILAFIYFRFNIIEKILLPFLAVLFIPISIYSLFYRYLPSYLFFLISLIVILINLAYIFLLGAIIGVIYKKIKDRKNKINQIKNLNKKVKKRR